MKRKYLLMVLVCFIAINSQAQVDNNNSNSGNNGKIQNWREVSYVGFKIGTNYSNVYDSDGESFQADPKFGLAAGVFIALPLGEYLGIQPEVLFSQKGYKAEGSLLGNTYVLSRTSNYIDIPLFITLKPVESLSILVGPQFSYLLSQKNKFENGRTSIEQEEEFDNENLRKNTLCFTAGADFNMNEIVLSGRVGWDLYKNNGDGSTTTPRYKNVWYQLTLGLRL